MHGASVNIADLDGVSPLLASIESTCFIGARSSIQDVGMEMEQSQELLQDMEAVLVPETLIQVNHRTACLQPIPDACCELHYLCGLSPMYLYVMSLSQLLSQLVG